MTRVPLICLATDSLEPSGVGEHMLALAAELRADFDIVLACPPSPGGRGLLDRAAGLGLGIRRLDDDDEHAVAGWLRRRRFALLHIHAGIGWEGHGLARLGRAAGVPRIVRTEHLPDVITDAEQRAQHAAGLADVDRVICVSDAAAQTHAAAGIDRGALTVIRNGIPADRAERSRAEIRTALGLDPHQPTVLTTARFTAQKDHRTLVAALPAVLARHPDLRVLLAGTGPLEPEIRAQVAATGVDAHVTFLGPRADVPDLLAAADLFVLPSRFEGLPLAVLEAMRAGLAVVATRVGGTDEAVIDGMTGRLVPPSDAEALASAMVDLLDDAARRDAFAEAGRTRYVTAFSARRMAAETADLYSSLGVPPGPADRTDLMDGVDKPRTRIGFIGAGGIAQRHLGILERFDDVELAAFADPAPDRAIAAAERFGAKSYTDFRTMLESEPLDALYICVPPFAHGAPERAAIAKNLPFFVEKPVSLDLDVAEEIGRAVAAAGLVTACGYHWRYLDTVDEARAILADNPAQLLSGYWLDSTPPPQWWWKQDQSGGQMVEQTTHLVDLARYLVGDVTQVFGLAGHKPRGDFPGLDVATASTASLRFASGAIGNFGSTCLLGWNHRVGLHVFGDKLAMEITDHDIMIDVGRGRPVRHAEGDPVWREDRDFVDAVRGGENRIRCPYHEALATHRVAMAIQRSAQSGQAIDLAQPVTKNVAEVENV